MEVGNKGSDDARPTYWLGACEEDDIIPCDFIGDFGNAGSDHSLFGGIDHIPDTFQNGAVLPCHNGGMSINITPPSIAAEIITNNYKEVVVVNSSGTGNGSLCEEIQVENMNCDFEVYNNSFNRVVKMDIDTNANHCDGRNCLVEDTDTCKVNGVVKDGNNLSDRERESEERNGKRSRVSGGYSYRDERSYSSRGQNVSRDWGSSNGRKRGRDWDDNNGRRDRDIDRERGDLSSGSSRRREYYNGRRESRDREWREREVKGYWERERPGSREIVYRSGSYEADWNRVGNKMELEKDREFNGRVEKNDVSHGEKNLEEQARQYQLDVLEQAKQENTIAFLETGAGKTLIAVLLIKSICNRLQQQDKKLLAVFLVPKVPLVYQQAEAIRDQTGYNVGHYCGEMGQDFWDT